ncbi:MAG: helix-turn-helix transcriptional regulator [Victivallales bacterium]|nr:helix-turn-helix transcriptional regulator [Victivallales bacterium]
MKKSKHEHSWSSDSSYDLQRREIWNASVNMSLPLFPYCMEEEIRSGNYWYKDKFTRYLLIIIGLRGKILFRFNTKDIILNRGDILIIPPGTEYLLQNVDEKSSHKLVLELIGNNLDSNIMTLGLNNITLLKTKEYLKIAAYLREIGNIIHEKKTEDIPLVVGLSYRFCTEIAMIIMHSENNDSLVARAQKLLESNFETKLTIKSLAKTLRCSTSLLNNKFRSELGITPLQYRLEKKIACARYLLCSTSLTIKEIAYKLGYCDPFYFSGEFCRMTGSSPTKVRKEKTLI